MGLINANKQYSHDQKIHLLLEAGVERHNKGEFAAANLVYEEIRKLDPKNAVALQLSGVLASQVGQQEISVTLLSRAITLKPDYVEALNNRGVVLKQMGQLNEALKDYNQPPHSQAAPIFQELFRDC